MSDTSSRGYICPDEVTLSAYFDGMLKSSQREYVEDHLANCEECREIIALLFETQKLTEEGTLEVPPREIVERAKSLVVDDSPNVLSKILGWLRENFTQPVFAPAAIVILVGLFSLLTINRQSPDSTGPSLVTSFNIVSMEMVSNQTRGELQNIPRKIEEIKKGNVMASGDYFNIEINMRESAYIYIILYDSLGNIVKLYPEGDYHDSIDILNQDILLKPIPFQLDTNTGREEVYIIASKQVIADFDERISSLRQSNIQNIYDVFPNSSVKMLWFIHD